MAIDARIAQVISPYEVAFNAGDEAGVHVNDNAWIFRDTEITDPDSGEPLGTVRRPSLRFRIIEVQPKLSVGTTVGTVRKPQPSPLLALQEAAERIRITTDRKDADYKTRVVELGAHVEIFPPEDNDEA
jgi:hypothetical protein